MIKGFDYHTEVTDFGRRVKVWIHKTVFHGIEEVVETLSPLTHVVARDPYGVQDEEPTLELYREDAQRLMNALWMAGFRPESSEGSEPQIKAIKAHLEDMRTLVFENKPR